MKGLKFLGKSALVFVAVICLMVGCISYLNWSAESKAKAFCADIAIGSDISIAVATAKKRNILWGDYRGYTFYFPGVMFDKAVCEVSVDTQAKVTSKAFLMEYD